MKVVNSVGIVTFAVILCLAMCKGKVCCDDTGEQEGMAIFWKQLQFFFLHDSDLIKVRTKPQIFL